MAIEQTVEMERFNQIMRENDECIESCISEGRAQFQRLRHVGSFFNRWKLPPGYITKLYVTRECDGIEIICNNTTIFEWSNPFNGSHGKSEEWNQTKIIDGHEFIEIDLPMGYIFSSRRMNVKSECSGDEEVLGVMNIPIEFKQNTYNIITSRVSDTLVGVYDEYDGFFGLYSIYDDETLGAYEEEYGDPVSIKDQIYI